ncbi:hypothetical protein F4775DRAFT_607473 [Biscogniauxia sp. FL1348]|nr:hypothetical protein F4775DRAFT_607473 [Biscogniauxia sp. FL1348]
MDSTSRSHQLPTEKRILRSNESRNYAPSRGVSMPRPGRPTSTPLPAREERYVPSDSKPSRSILRTCKAKMHKYRRRSVRYSSDDYDSDEFSDSDDEYDRHRSVPVTTTSNAGRALTPEVEAEVASRMCAAQARHRKIRRDIQRLSVRCEGEREEAVARGTTAELRDEMALLDLQMQNLFTQRLSFSADQGAVMRASPSVGISPRGRWSRQGDLVVWSMVGAAEEWAERGDNGAGDAGSLPLTHRGVDYNP